jgi:3' exoribonuclease, RNase T-like
MPGEDARGADSFCYVVTDIETDGPEPGANSMLSFASVVVEKSGAISDQFEACLAPLEGAAADPATLAWWQSQPKAWSHATRDPKPAADVMQSYVTWLRGLSHPAIFVAHPLVFDGYWIDWYLRKFLHSRLGWGFGKGDPPFHATGLDLPSLIMGTLGWDYSKCRRENYPQEWFGDNPHNHRAIDDALGYAHVLAKILSIRRQKPV